MKAQILQFYVQNSTKPRCFEAFPKEFQTEDIQIHYSCPPLPVQIR